MYLIRGNGEAFPVADTKILWLTQNDLKSWAKSLSEYRHSVNKSSKELDSLLKTTSELNKKHTRLKQQTVSSEVIKLTKDNALIENFIINKNNEYNLISKKIESIKSKEYHKAFYAKNKSLKEEQLEIGKKMIKELKSLSNESGLPLDQFLYTSSPEKIITLFTRRQIEIEKVPLPHKRPLVYTNKDVYMPYIGSRVHVYTDTRLSIFKKVDRIIEINKIALNISSLKETFGINDISDEDTRAKLEELTSHLAQLNREISQLKHKAKSRFEIQREAESAFEKVWQSSKDKELLDSHQQEIRKLGTQSDIIARARRSILLRFISVINHQKVTTRMDGSFTLPSEAVIIISYYSNPSIDANLGWIEPCNSETDLKNSNSYNTNKHSLEEFAIDALVALPQL